MNLCMHPMCVVTLGHWNVMNMLPHYHRSQKLRWKVVTTMQQWNIVLCPLLQHIQLLRHLQTKRVYMMNHWSSGSA